MPPLDYKYLCVVGSRKFSDYGVDAVKRLISGLRGYPIVIVSGMAIGIDSVAHEEGLRAGLATIAFPGSGLSRRVLYPACKQNLADRIVRNGGALMSSFDMEQTSTIWTFPARNRLMAGISHATLIIEGRKGSGTLLTAEYALDFGRDLMIVPGSIFSDLSYGPHLLMRDGAHPVTNSTEILKILGFEVELDNWKKDKDKDGRDAPADQPLPWSSIPLGDTETSIVKQLMLGPRSATQIIDSAKISTLDFNLAASKLELAEIIKESSGIFSLKNR